MATRQYHDRGDIILPHDIDLPTQGKTSIPAHDQPVLGPALDPGRPESDEPELVEPSACSSAQQPNMESNQEISDTETKVEVIDDDYPVVTGNSEVEPEAPLTSVDDGPLLSSSSSPVRDLSGNGGLRLPFETSSVKHELSPAVLHWGHLTLQQIVQTKSAPAELVFDQLNGRTLLYERSSDC